MKELLLFFEKDVFYEYKKHKLEEGYTIISIIATAWSKRNTAA